MCFCFIIIHITGPPGRQGLDGDLGKTITTFFQKCILILYNGKTKSMTQKHIKQMNSTCNAVFRLKVTVKCRCLYRYSVYENQLIPRKT